MFHLPIPRCHGILQKYSNSGYNIPTWTVYGDKALFEYEDGNVGRRPGRYFFEHLTDFEYEMLYREVYTMNLKDDYAAPYNERAIFLSRLAIDFDLSLPLGDVSVNHIDEKVYDFVEKLCIPTLKNHFTGYSHSGAVIEKALIREKAGKARVGYHVIFPGVALHNVGVGLKYVSMLEKALPKHFFGPVENESVLDTAPILGRHLRLCLTPKEAGSVEGVYCFYKEIGMGTFTSYDTSIRPSEKQWIEFIAKGEYLRCATSLSAMQKKEPPLTFTPSGVRHVLMALGVLDSGELTEFELVGASTSGDSGSILFKARAGVRISGHLGYYKDTVVVRTVVGGQLRKRIANVGEFNVADLSNVFFGPHGGADDLVPTTKHIESSESSFR